jgi:hypothetical protein
MLPQVALHLLHLVGRTLIVAVEDLDGAGRDLQELQNGQTLLVEFQGVNAVARQGLELGRIVALGHDKARRPALVEEGGRLGTAGRSRPTEHGDNVRLL